MRAETTMLVGKSVPHQLGDVTPMPPEEMAALAQRLRLWLKVRRVNWFSLFKVRHGTSRYVTVRNGK